MDETKAAIKPARSAEFYSIKEALAIEAEKILRYWEAVSWNPEKEIFYTLGCDNQPLADGSRSAVLTARVLWAYAAAYRMRKDPHDLEMAEYAARDLLQHFADETHGGFYAGLHADGTPVTYEKDTYTQCYAIYGLSELYLANGDKTYLDQAMKVFQLIEEHVYKQEQGIYISACDRAWNDPGGDLQADTYLHLSEAYTNLFKAGGDAVVKEALQRTVALLAEKFVRANGAVYQSMTRQWKETADLSDRYGDDAEACWMLMEAADAIGEPLFSEHAYSTACRLADNILTNGYDYENGGVFDRRYADGNISRSKLWWEESESVIAFLYAYRQTQKKEYADRAAQTWQFIQRYICAGDGSWNWMVKENGEAVPADDPSDPLMCPYHSMRIVTHSIRIIEQLQQVKEK